MAKPLNSRQVQRLTKYLANDPPPRTEAARRDAAAILLGLHGLRIEEVCRLRIDDYDDKKKTLRVATLKGGPQGIVPLTKEACRAIGRHLKGRRGAPPGAPLLATRTGRAVSQRNLRRRWQEWCGKALRVNVRFHDLRHTAAATAKRKGADITVVKRLLRHHKLATTELYWGSTDELRRYLPG